MRALISGQAGTAITFDGGIIRSIHIDEPDRVVEREEWEVERLLRGMTDTIELDNLSRGQVIEELESTWRIDRCLPLILILIDEGEEPETRQIVAEALSEFFSDHIRQHIGSILYAGPLPATADLPGAIGHSKHAGCTELTEFLEELQSNQGYIRVWRDAWRSLPLTLFDDLNEREQFRLLAIKAGAFYDLVTQQNSLDTVLLDLLLRQEFIGTTRAREVFQALTEPLRSKTHPKPLVRDVEETVLSEQKGSARSRGKRKGIHKKYANVETQIEAIKKLLTDGKKEKAIEWLNDLIESQRAESRPRYICQTLCNIAQHAKSLGDIPMQLELSEWAVREMPADGWAFAQVGDAYRALAQPNEALEAYGKAALLGEERVALCGKAALLKDSGNLNEALTLYEECVERYSDEPVARCGRAEVLKELCELSKALSAFNETIKLFPQDVVPRTGRAEVLKEQGKLSDALSAYDETIRLFQQDPFARCGRAEVLKEQGKLAEALLAYDETIKLFQQNPTARNGRAEVLKEQGKLSDALSAYDETNRLFPQDAVARTGRAEVLKELGELSKALSAFDEIIKLFPQDVIPRTGRAEVLKEQGKLSEALSAYDETIRLFPRNVVSRNGRAEVLKEQGKLSEALSAYDETIGLFPSNLVVRSGKASILVTMRRFVEALETLPSGSPATSHEWIACHIRGIALLKSCETEAAIDIFNNGIERNPWASQKPYFQTAFAMAMIRKQEYRKAIDSLQSQVRSSFRSVAKVLEIHAYGELAEHKKARSAFEEVRESKIVTIVEPRDELAGRFVFDDPAFIAKPEDWLFDRECDMVLAAAA